MTFPSPLVLSAVLRRTIASLALACLMAGFPSQAPASDARKVEVLLEKWVSQSWQPIDPGTVLQSGDKVRFRFSSNFDGYLYVTNLGTSGRYELLFPTTQTGADNRVEAGKSYLVPQTQAQFVVAGPAGHDVSFWMVSPTPLTSLDLLPAGGAPAAPRVPPHRMKPRCDDSLFRARGQCIDSSAGLRSVPDAKTLPESWEKLPRMQPRELFFMRQQETQVISAPGKVEGPMIYEFRIAHD